MNYTIQEHKHTPPQPRHPQLSHSCDVNVQRISYNLRPVIEDRIQDYFCNPSTETHRQSELNRLMKTSVLQAQTAELVETVASLYMKYRPPQIKIYTILKALVLGCSVPLCDLLSGLPSQATFYSILLHTSLFTPHNTLLLPQLEKAFFAVRESASQILEDISRQPDVDLSAGVKSLKKLVISTQEFKGFVLELWTRILKSR